MCYDFSILYAQSYAEVLESQLSKGDVAVGQHLSTSDLDKMNEQQLGQLLELKLETRKPR